MKSIEYENTLADLQALQHVTPLRKRLPTIARVILGMAAITAPGTALLLVMGDLWGLAIAWGLQLAMVGWFYVNARRASVSADPKLLRPTWLSLDDYSVEHQTGIGWGRRDWSLIKSVEQSADFVLLYISEREAFAVPRRAFASPAEAAAFADEAQRAWERSRQSGYVPLACPIPADAMDDGLSGIPTTLQVRFQNTAEELMTLQFNGLAEPKGLWQHLGTWFWVAIVTPLLVWFAWQRREPTMADQAVSVLSFFLIELVAFILLRLILRRLAVRDVEPCLLDSQCANLSANGVFVSAPLFEHRFQWSAIDEIAENGQFIVLYLTKPRYVCAIPKHAFEHSAQAADFVQLARQWKAAAVYEQEHANVPPRAETSNPYQSPDQN